MSDARALSVNEEPFVGHRFTKGLNPASIGLALGAACFAYVQTATFLPLQRVMAFYEVSISTAAWSLLVCTIGVATMAGIAPGLGVRFGMRRAILVGAACQFIGAIVCIFAPNITWHLVGRGLQVLGGANFTLGFAMCYSHWVGTAAKRAQGIIAAGAGLGGVVSGLSSGLIMNYSSALGTWRYTFIALAVMAASSFVMVFRFTREGPTKRIRIDYLGGVGLAAWLVLVLLPLTQASNWGWGSARVIGLLAAGGCVLAAWIPYQLWKGSRSTPFLDIRILARRGVLKAALIFGVASWFGGTFGLCLSYLQVPHFLQAYGFGWKPITLGWILSGSAACSIIGGPLAGWLAGRGVRYKTLLLLGVVQGVIFYGIIGSWHESAALVFVCFIFLSGVNYAFISTGSIGQSLLFVKPLESGVTAGMIGVFGSCCSSIATAVGTYILTTKEMDLGGGALLPVDSRMSIVWLLASGIGVLGLVLALSIPRSAHVHVTDDVAPAADAEIAKASS